MKGHPLGVLQVQVLPQPLDMADHLVRDPLLPEGVGDIGVEDLQWALLNKSEMLVNY